MKKVLSLFLAVAIIVSVIPATVFAAFSDVKGHWGQQEIEKWSSRGIIQGSNGNFHPNTPITRGEMAVILDKVMKYQVKVNNTFVDLDKSWYTDAILKANAAKIILGSNNAVRPKDNITREEAAVMFGRAFGVKDNISAISSELKDSGEISSWAGGYVDTMLKKGYVKGDSNGNFKPKTFITRAEVVKILDNFTKELFNKEGIYSDKVIEGNVVINSPSVTLKNIEIKGSLIVAEGVGEGDVRLDKVKIAGDTILKGGGTHSVYFNDVTIDGAFIVNKVDGNIRIVATGTTSVSVVTLKSGAILITKELTGGSIEKVEIPADLVSGQNIVLQGNFKYVENNASNASIQATGKIEKLILNKSATVTGGAEVTNITAAKGADSVVNNNTVTGGTDITSSPSSTLPKASTPGNSNVGGGGSGGSSGSSGGAGNSSGSTGGSNSSGNNSNSSNNPQTYTINFNTNGGSVIDSVYVTGSGTITLPAAPIKPGYNFAGWYTDGGLTCAFNPSTIITSNITLYAKWIDDSVQMFKITFNTNGGSVVDAVYSASGETITLPTAPTKSGYNFDGWYTDAGLTQAFNTTVGITSDMILYAKWNLSPALTYTVTFDTNGGSDIDSITVITGGKISLPEAPTKSGVSFIGWYTDKELTQAFDISTVVISNITLYAKWSGWQEPVQIDSRFASGYPKSSVNASTNNIELKVKLTGASVSNPMEVFMVVNQMNSHISEIDSTAVIHGHAGSNEDLIFVDDQPYIKITDDNEHTIPTKASISGRMGVKIYFVIRDSTTTSSTPTMLEYSQVAVTELDQTAPQLTSAYINSAKNKITLYFDEKLDTLSVPPASSFVLSDGTVSGVNISDCSFYNGSKLELTLDSSISNISGLTVSYNVPSVNPLKDKATTPNLVAAKSNIPVSQANLRVDSAYASNDGQYIAINIDKSLFIGTADHYNVTLRYGDSISSAALIDKSLYIMCDSVANDGRDMSIRLKFHDLPSLTSRGRYYITVDPNGLKDFAGDDVAALVAEAVPNAMPESSISPISAVYNASSDSITLTFDDNSGLVSGSIFNCSFKLKVGASEYILRGTSYGNFNFSPNSITLTQHDVPFDMNQSNMSNATISYSFTSTNNTYEWERLGFASGKPYDGFSNIQITVQP